VWAIGTGVVRWAPPPSTSGTLAAVGRDRELEFYRRVEELFATFRGVPHLLSPRDFQLLRRWWAEEVPLEAVRGGLAEVSARRHEKGETDPVVSLSYCRHAVERHARRLAEMRVGAAPEPDEPGDARTTAPAAAALADLLDRRAAGIAGRWPGVAEAVAATASEVRGAAGLPPAALEERLFDLDAALLSACWRALPEDLRREIDRRAGDAARATATGDGVDRAHRAMRDRDLRGLLELPRLELLE